jgi:DNA-binding transcriptional ArsR family regulator
MSAVDGTLLALADPTRRRVVDALAGGPRRAGELARLVRVSPPSMSRHLRVLRKSGLVAEAHTGEDARVRVYQLLHSPFGELRDWLANVETFWTLQLGAFKERAEARGRKT